jgi:hypothetical protein
MHHRAYHYDITIHSNFLFDKIRHLDVYELKLPTIAYNSDKVREIADY